MSRYLLTHAAEDDLDEIWEYIAADNPAAADRVVSELFEAMTSLAELPGMGHRRDDLADETLRVWPVRSYLIIYRPDQSPVQVIRILSGFRDLFALFATQ